MAKTPKKGEEEKMLELLSQPGKALSVVMIMLLVILGVGVSGYVEEVQRVVRIGAVYPLTGPMAAVGTDIRNGILLAVDIINDEHDLDIPLASLIGIESLNGAKLKVIFGDSQGSALLGRSETERLIDEENVVAVIGSYQSVVTAEASQAAEDRGIPFLTALSTTPSLTQRGFNWFFRTTPNEETFVQNLYEFLQDIQEKREIRVDRLAVVHEDSIWGKAVGEHAEQQAREHNYQMVEFISYSSDTTDVTSEVQRLKDANPDVIIQASYVNDAILYMQTYRESGVNPQAILADDNGFIATEFLRILGEDGNYILTRENWTQDLAESKPIAGTINQIFRERYGTNMNGFSARTFTGVLVLADAISRAGATDPAAIRDALLETDIPGDKLIMPWDGVKFDQNTHQNVLGKGIICQIIDQEYRVVWPQNLATEEPIWPMPEWEERQAVKLPFSPAVRAGDYVFVSGQKGIRNPETGELIEGIVGQTRQCMENMNRALAAVGSSLDDVVKVTVFLGDVADYADMNEVYRSYFPKELPARSTAVTGLVIPNMLIEIDCIAYSPLP